MKFLLTVFFTLLTVLQFSTFSISNAQEKEANGSRSIKEILNADGSLKTDKRLSGSFDPSGYSMKYGSKGEPQFVPVNGLQTTIPGDERWDDQFKSNINGEIHAIVPGGEDVYVAGSFTIIGGISANRIAKWNSTTGWSALGDGMNNTCLAIAVDGNSVYVGGFFSIAGGVPANRIAKWDGSNWSALGDGLDGSVYSIVVNGNDVYVGGQFATAGAIPASNIAKWNGSTWSALGAGITGNYVVSVAINGNDIYVGGDFTVAGEAAASSIAKWDGSSWSALTSGVDGGFVNSIKIVNGDVYVGGVFASVGGVLSNNISKWDGSNWSALGDGVNGDVYSIAVSDGAVYVGGGFTAAGEIPASNIAKWDGSAWSALGDGVNASVTTMAANGDELYVGGPFSFAGETALNRLAKFSNGTWSSLIPIDNAPDGMITAIAINGEDVYVGGNFYTVGGLPANRVAKWNGAEWSALGLGVDNYVGSIAVNGTDVYVGGGFTFAGGIPANRIAKWDGSAWEPLSEGVNGNVSAIAINGDDVYVGGDFNLAGGIPVNSIAKWDGNNWSSLSDGVNGVVNSIAVNGNNVYVGGAFTMAGEMPCNNIALWNGTWGPLGDGVNGGVSSIAVSGSDVYIAGPFTTAGGSPANHVAKWSNFTWSSLGDGVNEATSIAVNGNTVYVGGALTNASSIPANRIAKWDGSTWSALGNGLTGGSQPETVVIAVSGNDVYVGGDFEIAGGKASKYFARYRASNLFLSKTIPDTTLNEDFGKVFRRKLSDIFVSSEPPAYETSVLSGDVLTEITNDTLYVLSSSNWFGQAEIRVTAVSGNASVSDTFNVTVNSINDLPTITTTFRDTTYGIGFGKTSVYKVSEYLMDADNDPLSYTATNLSNGVTVLLSNDTLYLSGGAGFTGNVEIRVSASDAQASIADTFTVHVVDNIQPEVYAGALATELVDVIRLGVGSSETLKNLNVQAGNQNIAMTKQGNIYFGNYQLGSAPNVTFSIEATDMSDNKQTMNKTYGIAQANKNHSYGGYTVKGEGTRGYVLMSKVLIKNPSPSWRAIGEGLEIMSTAKMNGIELKYGYAAEAIRQQMGDDETFEEGKIGVYRLENGEWVYVGGQGERGVVKARLEDGLNKASVDQAEGVIAVFYNPEHVVIPTKYELEQNYPNPFNPVTQIRYQLPVGGRVSLKVYNILGQEVRTLVNEVQSEGFKQVLWDGKNELGKAVGSGIYIYRVQVGSFIKSRKMMLIR